MATKSRAYNAEDIEILEDLSPILHRPGMYTDPVNPNHALVEVIDNSSDEGLAGFAKNISVVLYEDGSAEVADDGRGIPVDIHPKKKVPAVQVIFTTLHSGGKFRKTDKDAAYRIAGGLHGVGICVTNALVDAARSRSQARRRAPPPRVRRQRQGEGAAEEDRHGRGRARPARASASGPIPKYFDSPKIVAADIAALLRAKAMLLPGVRFTLGVEKNGKIETQTWHFPEGIKGYFASAIAGLEPVAETFFGERYIAAQSESDSFAEGEGALWAIAWTPEGEVVAESYVNMIPTRHGGTHVAGLREGVYNAISNFIDLHAMGQRGIKIVPEDVWSRASYVLSVKMLDPQFKGQVKNELISRDAVKLMAQMVRDPFELWLNQHVDEGKRIAELVIRQAMARTRAAQKVERRKSSGVAVLPGKLTDCASDDPERNELFIVEGDSAGGSAKQARDKEFQAVLPLKGKPKNTWQDCARHAVREQGNRGDRARDRRRPSQARRGRRHVAAALPQDHHPGRRRCRRRAHPGAAADAVLPPFSAADRKRQRVRGAAAAVPHRRAVAWARASPRASSTRSTSRSSTAIEEKLAGRRRGARASGR